MQKFLSSVSFSLSFAALLLLMPAPVFASILYMETNDTPVSVGDTIVVGVYLDADAESNALDGTINLSLGMPFFTVQEVSLAGSVLTLWPRTPSLSSDGTHITFTGGVPQGFKGPHQPLFNIILTARAAGTASIIPTDSTVYLSDGKGTPLSVTTRALSLPVAPAQQGVPPRNSWQPIVSGDVIAPDPFTIFMGQDPSVYDGKKYIFFETTDVQSGIDYYEVKEGDAAPVRSGSTYVLQDQAHRLPIVVYAYDKAGNVRASVYGVGNGSGSAVAVRILVLGLVLLIGIYSIWRFLRRRPRI